MRIESLYAAASEVSKVWRTITQPHDLDRMWLFVREPCDDRRKKRMKSSRTTLKSLLQVQMSWCKQSSYVAIKRQDTQLSVRQSFFFREVDIRPTDISTRRCWHWSVIVGWRTQFRLPVVFFQCRRFAFDRTRWEMTHCQMFSVWLALCHPKTDWTTLQSLSLAS